MSVFVHIGAPVLLAVFLAVVVLRPDDSATPRCDVDAAPLERSESWHQLAASRDGSHELLQRAHACAESDAHAARRVAAAQSAVRASLRNVVPLTPWLLAQTYASDLFDDVLDDVVARAVAAALQPLRRDAAAPPWLYIVTAPPDDAELQLAVANALAARDDVALLRDSQLRAALGENDVSVLLDWNATVSGSVRVIEVAHRLGVALRLPAAAALAVAVVDDAPPLLRVRAAVWRTFPDRLVLQSAGEAVGENRVAQATLASRLFAAAFAVAALLPSLLRRLEWLDAPAADSDVYAMRFLACPIGVLLGVLSPLALDQIFSGFLPMLRPDSPAQLASSGWWFPLLCAVLLQVTPVLLIALVAPRLPRLADALRERWLAPALALGVGIGGGTWLLAGHLVLRSTTADALATAPLLPLVFFFAGRAGSDAMGGVATAHPNARIAVCVAAAAATSLDIMLGGSTFAGLRTLCRLVALLLVALAVRMESLIGLLWPGAAGVGKGRGGVGGGGFAAAMAASRAAGDDDARELLATDFDALRQRVMSAHGLPLVGNAVTARRQVREALAVSEPFRFVVLRGARGHGKSRTIADAVAECGSSVQTFVGDASGNEQSDSPDARCPPYEPIRKALGRLVGINRFKSAKEQWAVLEGAADFAESISGLGLVLGIESGDGGGGGGESGAPIDSAVLADAVVRAVVREARELQRKQQRMVLLFEDMEHCDKESGQLLTAAVSELARRGASAPLTLIVCERNDDPDSGEPSGWLATCVKSVQAAQLAGAAVGDAFSPTPAALSLMLRPLAVTDVAELLDRIGFQPAFAVAVAPSLHERAAGNPLWLCAMLRVLVARREQLESTIGGWRLPAGKSIDDVELPGEIKAALMRTLEQLSEAQLRILFFASHIGLEFEASILATAMGVEPMALLWELVQIESSVGVVHDVIDVDDLYRFASGGFVAALRGYASELLGAAANEQLPTQLSRQCHLQIADALVHHDADVASVQALQDLAPNSAHHALAVPERSAAAWFRLARHAVAAGSKRASLAFVSCCAAARAARAQSALDATVRYCNLALEREAAALSTASASGDAVLREAVVARADATRLLLADSLLFVTAKNSAQALRVIAGHSQPAAPAAQVLRALAHAYAFNLAEASQLAAELAEREGNVPAVTRAEALWVLTFAAMKGNTAESWAQSQAHAKHALTLLRNEVDEAAAPLQPLHLSGDGDGAPLDTVAELLRQNERHAWLVDRRDAQLKRAAKCVAAKTLGVVGGLYIHCVKDLNAAEIAVRHSMRLKKDVGDLVGQGIAASQLALILMRRASAVGAESERGGELLNDAVLWLNENEQISHKLGSEIGLVLAPKSLGECALRRGNSRTATAHFERCHERSVRFGDAAIEIAALCGLVAAATLDGNAELLQQRVAALEARAAKIAVGDRVNLVRPSAESLRDMCAQLRSTASDAVDGALADAARRAVAVLETFGIK